MLTKTDVDRTLPRSAPYVLWDDELGGFGCRVFPSGKRSFVVRYRLPGSRKALLMTLGAYGVLTVAEARGQARETLAKIRLGQDPQAEAIARRAAEAAQASVSLWGSWSSSILPPSDRRNRSQQESARASGSPVSRRHGGAPEPLRYSVWHPGRRQRHTRGCRAPAEQLYPPTLDASPYAWRDQPHVCLGTAQRVGEQRASGSQRNHVATVARARAVACGAGTGLGGSSNSGPLYSDTVQPMVTTWPAPRRVTARHGAKSPLRAS